VIVGENERDSEQEGEDACVEGGCYEKSEIEKDTILDLNDYSGKVEAGDGNFDW